MRSAVSPGAIRQISQCCLRLPPSLPNNPNTFIPRDFAATAARTTFSEFPLVESTTSRSPGCPSANSGRAKISANPKSFAVQVMCPSASWTVFYRFETYLIPQQNAQQTPPISTERPYLPVRSCSAVAAMVRYFQGG